MTTQLARWGNSLGLRIPKGLADRAQLVEGDAVQLAVEDGAIIVRAARPQYRLDDLIKGITSKNRHKGTDWGRPVGREAW
jgi:antitoxin MazE